MLLSLGVIASSCSSNGSSNPISTGGAALALDQRSTTTSEPQVVGDWITIEPQFELGGDRTQQSLADVQVIASAAGAYWAAGNLGGRPIIWRSTDLENFEFVYLDPWTPEQRFMRFNTIVEFDDKVLVGASGQVRTDSGSEVERSFLLATGDDGKTWAEVDDPLLTEPFQRLVTLTVSDNTVVADVATDGALTQPNTPARTTELSSWEPVALPQADPGTWITMVSDGRGTLWAHATERDDDGAALVVWASTDGGSTWKRDTAAGPYGSAAAVAGSVVFMPDHSNSVDFSHPVLEPRSPLRFADGEWTELERDFGQWGDGDTRISGIVDSATGRFYGKLRREIRANPHYCFDDVDSCAQTEEVLVTSADGIEWTDLVGGPDLGASPSGLDHELFMTADGRIALWNRPLDESGWGPITVNRWTGDPVPPTTDPPDYPAPEQPVPYFDADEGLPVGTEQRYAWPVGGCGYMHIDDIPWAPTDQPDTTDWPIREVAVEDGPSEYAFGRVERLAEDRIQFTIENTNTAVAFTPC